MPVARTRPLLGILHRSRLALLSLGIGAALVPPLVLADEPLLAPADYVQPTPNGRFEILGQVEPPLTSIIATGEGTGPTWVIDGYHRNVLVAEDGASALLLPEGGSLIVSDDPDLALLSYHHASGAMATILLRDVMDPAKLVPTVSHFLWMTGAVARGPDFVLTLADGSETRIDASTGVVLNSP